REAGDLRVGGDGEEEVHTFLTEAREGAQVGDAAVQRELVHLEVARVQHGPGAGAEEDGEAVADRVVDLHELQVEDARPVLLPRLDLDCLWGYVVLPELRGDERESQL